MKFEWFLELAMKGMMPVVARSQKDLLLVHPLGDWCLIEREFLGFILVHVGQVEGETDNIALYGVVAFIIIVINDVQVSVLEWGRNILEVIEVKRVGQDIVWVTSLQCPSLSLLGNLQSLLLLDSKELQAEGFSCVFILFHGPVAVLVVESSPVVVNVLIQLNITNL